MRLACGLAMFVLCPNSSRLSQAWHDRCHPCMPKEKECRSKHRAPLTRLLQDQDDVAAVLGPSKRLGWPWGGAVRD